MQAQNYGGFTPSLPGIDVRFSRPEHVDHFVEAWGRPGVPPVLPAEGAWRTELMSIGTIFEHELRHFHDHLLCYESLQASWIKRQMWYNGAPAISNILNSDEHDVVPFPLLQWAELSDRERARSYDELKDLFPGSTRRFWSPKSLHAKIALRDGIVRVSSSTAKEKRKSTQQALHGVRAARQELSSLRYGLDPTPLDQGRFTPRFVHEFSAMATQIVAVATTYGEREAIEFMAMIATDSSTYNSFFTRMMHLFGSKGRYGNFDPSAVDFQKMNAVAFWAMTGGPQDGTKAGPATRLSTLMCAAEEDWEDVFPPGVGTLDLLDHFDRRTGCVPYRTSFDQTQARLQDLCNAAFQFVRSLPGSKDTHTRAMEVFSTVLHCRAKLIAAVKADPMHYVAPDRWMKDLNAWPQCPVHLSFSSARMYIAKEDLHWCGPDAQFNVTSNPASTEAEGYAGDVYMPSLFPGTARIPLQPVIETQRTLLLFDLLFDPEQVSANDENAVRTFVRETFGKDLVRLI